DRPEDVPNWRQIAESADAGPDRVSVVIPALNEAAQIATTLEAARAGCPHEIIVADGGSADDTRPIARSTGAKVLQSQTVTARQMNAGAARASGKVLLFLHADTQLPEDWP